MTDELSRQDKVDVQFADRFTDDVLLPLVVLALEDEELEHLRQGLRAIAADAVHALRSEGYSWPRIAALASTSTEEIRRVSYAHRRGPRATIPAGA